MSNVKVSSGHQAEFARPRAFVLTAGDPTNDPRIGWVARSLAKKFHVTEIGIFRDQSQVRSPELLALSSHHCRITAPATPWPAYVPEQPSPSFGENDGWSALAGFAYETASTDKVLGRKQQRLSRSTWERHEQLRRILRTNASLIRVARVLGHAELIVAADVEALAAGVALKQELSARLIYDAHEFWPYSFPQFSDADEEQAWVRIERSLLKATDVRFAVSPGLADAMSKEYGVEFRYLPNAAPLVDAPDPPTRTKDKRDSIDFLFLGGFAPERGLKHLIDAWPKTPSHCRLVLQGPESAFKREMIRAARGVGLFGSRIIFPPPVAENQLISKAAQADVGVIPYEPTLINHVHCSPNKLSQYMAAGLPVLANNTRFVEQIVSRAACGLTVDFSDSEALVSSVQRLASNAKERERLGDNARRAFVTFFNWEAFEPALDEAAGQPVRSGLASAPTEAVLLALITEFQDHAPRRESQERSAIGRFGRSALRLGMKAAWHGVPFLRIVMLNNPRFRRRAEELREL